MAINTTNDGLELIKQRFGIDLRTDPNVQALADEFKVAQMVYDARQAAGKTHKQLAESIGASEAEIVALEDADYDGDSLLMLRRIAVALNMKLRVELVPVDA